jgi:hypothetical protein
MNTRQRSPLKTRQFEFEFEFEFDFELETFLTPWPACQKSQLLRLDLGSFLQLLLSHHGFLLDLFLHLTHQCFLVITKARFPGSILMLLDNPRITLAILDETLIGRDNDNAARELIDGINQNINTFNVQVVSGFIEKQ